MPMQGERRTRTGLRSFSIIAKRGNLLPLRDTYGQPPDAQVDAHLMVRVDSCDRDSGEGLGRSMC